MFDTLRRESRCGLIAYVTCGDRDTLQIVEELERAGADAIELGVPFSDPIADGPVIQAASQRALASGTSIGTVLELASRIRERSEIPLVAFSYLNPVLRYGVERFAADASQAGIDSLLLTDMPPENADDLRSSLKASGIGTVFLAAPTSSARRLKLIDRASDGFVYCVSTTGVTGTRSDLDPSLLDRLGEVRAALRNPIAVGFGISRHEHYVALRDRCDAVVVGSAIVRAVAEGDAAGAPRRAGNVVRTILGGL
ncbi:MAG TPA: tryptophan synthase subunit alpha [Thermoanaerobaculia bacterium]